MAQSETTSRISYVRKEKLGSGAFGKVYKAQDIRTKWIYALKVIKCYNNDELKDALMESKVMDELHHPNILTLAQVDVYQDTVYEANVCILFEYCLGGNLNDRLRQPSSKEQNVRWMFQMADAVDHLHSKKIVHRDLKPDNILLTFSEDIKIGDFGFARKFVAMKREEDTWATHYNTNGARLAYMAPEMISLELYMKSKRGTPIYMAPEVNSMHYTHKADVFSLGLLFYAVEERCFFNAERRYYGAFTPTNVGMVPLADQMLRQGGDVDIPFKSSNKRLVRIISGSLQFDYKKRPNAAQLKRQFEECFDDYIKESKNIKVE